MLVFGSCVGGDGTKFRTVTEPTIDAVKADEDILLTRPGTNGICEVYNGFIDHVLSDEVTAQGGCDALVLLHDDVELRDPEFRDKVLRAASEPGVGIIGVVGGRDLTSLSWWDARHLAGRVEEPRGVVDFGARDADVDALDGLMLILTPAALQTLRFDQQNFPAYHGYDGDICLQARDAGLRVVTRDIEVFHRTKGGFGNRDAFTTADDALMRKWSSRIRPLTPVEKVLTKGRRGLKRVRHLVSRRPDTFRDNG